MMLAYLSQRLNLQSRRWDAERAKIRTADQLRARNRFVRAKVREMAGLLPIQVAPKVPLNARVTRTIQHQGYRIENVLFQSQADYWIPANVYVPAGAGPFPAIVLERGHFNAERMSVDYQQLHFDLVTNGFVVLAFDSIGQGERRQYYEADGEDYDELLSPALEHCAIGGLLSLIGESPAGWFAWDIVRAIDYLAARPDVARGRIGCADHTDTGWSMTIAAALDERIRCAAIHIRGRARRWPLELSTWNTTDDPEEFLFPAASYGIDMGDILGASAPRPLLTLIEDHTSDFDREGERLQRCYSLLGEPDHFAMERAGAGNDWPITLRLSTVRWFRHWLNAGSDAIREEEAVPEPYQALAATPKGSLRESRLGKPVYAVIRQRAANLPPPRTPSGADLDRLRGEIRLAIGPPGSPVPLGPREISSDRLEGYTLTQVEFLTEPGVYSVGALYKPSRPGGASIVYVSGDVTTFVSDDDDAASAANPAAAADTPQDRDDQFARAMVRKGHTVLLAGVRGLGATEPSAARRDLRGPWEHLHNSDVALANMAWSLGDSLFAMRVRDLLRAVEYASRFGQVRLAGRDMGALWAWYAAVLDPRVVSVATDGGLASYKTLVGHGRYSQAVSQFQLRVLQRFDLPHVVGAIAPRPVTILNPTDHRKAPIDAVMADAVYDWTQIAYATADAADRIQVVFGAALEDYAVV